MEKFKSTCADVQATRTFYHLRRTNNGYFVTKRLQFEPDGVIPRNMLKEAFKHAYDMTFGEIGEYRENRSGGDRCRDNREIFVNAFQGKLAECALSTVLSRYDSTAVPDYSKHKRKKWDTGDLHVCGKNVSVKSTKHYGQLLLLETNDYSQDGRYLHNKKESQGVYDCTVSVRLKPSCEDLLKTSELERYEHGDWQYLWELIAKENWEYNIAGYITRDDLIYIIRNKYILPKGAMLNGKQRMDAENYYVQVCDLRKLDTLAQVIGLE